MEIGLLLYLSCRPGVLVPYRGRADHVSSVSAFCHPIIDANDHTYTDHHPFSDDYIITNVDRHPIGVGYAYNDADSVFAGCH